MYCCICLNFVLVRMDCLANLPAGDANTACALSTPLMSYFKLRNAINLQFLFWLYMRALEDL